MGYFASFGVTGLGSPAVVAQTKLIQTTGTYYVNATAQLFIDPYNDQGAFCYVTTGSNGFHPDGLYGGSSSFLFQQASIADSWFVTAGDVVQLVCYSIKNDSQTSVRNASLTATLINSPEDAEKEKHSRHAPPNQAKAPK